MEIPDTKSPKRMAFTANAVKVRLIGLFIALSLSVTYYYLIKPWAMGIPGNSTNFWVFSAMSHANYHLNSLYEVWRPRVGGLWLAGRLVDSVVHNGQLKIEDIQHVFGLYHACWLFLFFAMLVFLVEDPIFIILGCFAGLFYMLTPRTSYYSYPWDMPSMLFFTLSYLLWLRKRYLFMLVVILFGTFFKETVAVTALLFFFTDLSWGKRVAYFMAAFFSTLFLKIAITLAVDGKIEILTQDLTRGNPSGKLMTLVYNIKDLFNPQWNHFVFVNAGTFIVALLLPMRTKIEMGTKAILLLFFCGQMLAGSLNEFRIMLEVLPVSILYLKQTLDSWKGKIPAIQQAENKSPPVTLKKSPGISRVC